MNNKGWFKKEEVGKTYYTWFADKEYKHKVISPDGDRMVTPRELCDFMNQNPDWNIHDEYTGDVQASVAYKTSDVNLGDKRVVLPDGAYKCRDTHYGNPDEIHPIELRRETLIERAELNIIREDIEQFVQSEEIYKEHGIYYKRGYLLFGEPGEGKTTIIRQLIQDGPLGNAIVLFTNTVPEADLLNNLAKYDSNRLKVFVFEELTTTVKADDEMRRTLNFLDGEFSLHKMITIATTNYPEDLPNNIVSRPSRFDKLLEIGRPNEGEISGLIRSFTGATPSKEETQEIHGISTAAVKEVCLLSMMKDISLSRALETLNTRLKESRRFKPGGKTSIGFTMPRQ
ncbi:MAG: AAA family ATPase [Candidatus Thorarchaeota archaeon]|jgi:AAA+ superfamily predicted ATPase